MSSTFGVFESARSGLSVAMQQLNVTEQNIANVNTEGYTRQRILTSAKEPANSAYLIGQLSKALVGQGVEATGIQQIRSAYLDQQYRDLNSGFNYSATRNQSLTYLTGLYNELNDGSSLTTAVGRFFSALNTFSTDTSSKEFRTNVQQQAMSMTQSFNNVYEEMQSLWQDQNDNISTIAQKINSMAQKIAQLNDSIARAEQTGGVANDLNDERNLLLDELSSYVNITYSFNTKNASMIDVKIGGLSLVNGRTANEIGTDTMANNQAAINGLLNTIASLNTTPPPSDPTALNDAIQELKNYGNFNVAHSDPDDLGSDFVVKLGGQTLVTGTTVAMTVQDAAATDVSAWAEYNRNWLTLDDPATTGVVEALDIGAGGPVTGGQLYASMEMITSNSASSPGIPYYMNQLNALVRDIAKNINDIHQTGYTYPDGSSASQNDVIFFEVPQMTDGSTWTDGTNTYDMYDYSKLTAGNFAISDAVLQSVYNIAGSSNEVVLGGDSTETGNNDIALKLFKDLANNGYYDKLNSMVANLAIATNTSGSIMDTRQSLLSSVDMQRSSISAVSLDEETTNLIIFQQSYNAAAKIISTLDEMLNTLINNMGMR